MTFDYDIVKDSLDVLVVPLSLGLLALLWPALAARKRRRNFQDLIRRELMEARPYGSEPHPDAPWHTRLTKRFLHEEIISHPTENIDFVLSVDPRLAYHLSQMWIAFRKAERETEEGSDASPVRARDFCWHLGETKKRLGLRYRCKLRATVWRPWSELIESTYPRDADDRSAAVDSGRLADENDVA